MIASFSLLRALVLLRNIARSLESLAASQHTLATIATARHDRAQQRRTRKPRATEFGTLDMEEVNKRWHARQEGEWQEP